MQMALSEEVVCRVKSGRAVMNVTLVLGDHVAKGLPNKCKHWRGAMSKESNSEFRELEILQYRKRYMRHKLSNVQEDLSEIVKG